jgi:hypothetical protein
MANSYVKYSATGSTDVFALSFSYLDQAHVSVTKDGSAAPFTWLSPTQVKLSTIPAANARIVIRRTTPPAPAFDANDGSTLTHDDLLTLSRQVTYIAQETADLANDLAAASIHADTEEIGINFILPNAAGRANKIIAFSNDGKTVNLLGDGTLPTGPQGPQGIQGVQGPQGPQGPAGTNGQSYQPNATGITSARSLYDAQVAGFSFLDTSTSKIYFKISSVSGDWSSGVSFGQGPQGIQGIQGPKGDKGDQGIQGVAGGVGPTGGVGPAGPGVPAGGTAGQVPIKNSTTNYDVVWGQVDTAGLKDGGVTNAKLAGSIAFAKLASDAANAKGARTVSTGAPSGGADGDIWYQV